MIDTISADYVFISEQVSSTCCTEFWKEQAKKIVEIGQKPLHQSKVRGFRNERKVVCVMV